MTMPFRRVVFLDFDGVVNNDGCLKEQGIEGIDPMNVACVNYIMRKVPSEVVISSTWRLSANFARLRQQLEDAGFEYGSKIVDFTPQIRSFETVLGYEKLDANDMHWRSVDRGYEIETWLRLRNFHGQFVILDDESMGRLALHHVKTDPKFGLQLKDAEKAVEILYRQSVWP
jgi:hypothetical protein